MSESLLLIFFGLILLPGIVGAVLPLLPSVPYMFVVALVFGFTDSFFRLDGRELLVLGGLALLSLLVDYTAGVLGAKYSGANTRSLGFGLIGLFIGIVLVPPLGGLVGLFVGIFLAEYYRHQNRERAIKAASGGLLGSVVGIVINLTIALTFFGLFLYFVLR